MSEPESMGVHVPVPMVEDEETLATLNPILDSVDFWSGMWNLETPEMQTLIKADIEERRRKQTQIPDSWLQRRTHAESSLRQSILNLISKCDDDFSDLEDNLLVYIMGYDRLMAGRWLLAWLRVHGAVPQGVLSVARQLNEDRKLIDPAKPRKSVLKLLNKIHDDNNTKGFQGLRYNSSSYQPYRGDCAYYIGSPDFRHEGRPNTSPTQVFIKRQERDSYCEGGVHVYNQERGSGKTVELAASSYTREALFTIMLTDVEDVPLIPDGHSALSPGDSRPTYTQRSYRERDSLLFLASKIKSTLMQDESNFKRLRSFVLDLDEKREAQRAAQSEAQREAQRGRDRETLQIVVAIDEANNCPNLITAIIEEYSSFGYTLGCFIMHGCPDDALQFESHPADVHSPTPLKLRYLENPLKMLDVRVLFSIAAADVTQYPTGRMSDNYECRKTSAKEEPGVVYKLLSKMEWGSLDSYREIYNFPLVKAIIYTNARMASIFVAVLKRKHFANKKPHKNPHENPQEQNDIISEVFATFMRDAALKDLMDDPSRRVLVASRVLATLLFQSTRRPAHKSEFIARPYQMESAIKFERFDTDTAQFLMRELVVDYGLMGTTRWDGCLFPVSDAMQLLCLWLLQGGSHVTSSSASSSSLLGASPRNFGTLTTLMVGAAVAAWMAVAEDQRMDIRCALAKVGIGFFNQTVRTSVIASCRDTHPASEGASNQGASNTRKARDEWAAWAGVQPVTLSSDLNITNTYFHESKTSLHKLAGVDGEHIHSMTGSSGVWRHVPDLVSHGDDQTQHLSMNDDTKPLSSQMLREEHAALLMDTDLRKHLADLSNGQAGDTKIFNMPIISVAQSDGHFADGYVTFLGRRMDKGGVSSGPHELFTICIQNRNYFENEMDAESIRKTASNERLSNKELDRPLGMNRLYCVARRESDVARDCEQVPPGLYTPYVADKSCILRSPEEPPYPYVRYSERLRLQRDAWGPIVPRW